MPNHSSDLHDSDVPLLARFVYELYPYDALSFEIESIQKMIDRISELYPDSRERKTVADSDITNSDKILSTSRKSWCYSHRFQINIR